MESDLKNRVMQEIEARGVKMRPKFYFVATALLLGAGVAGAFMTALLLAVRIMIQMRLFPPMQLFALGGPGARHALVTLPWISLGIAIAAIAVGVYLLKQYDFAYKHNFLPIAVGVVAAVIVLGLVIGHAAWRAEMHEHRQVGPFLKRPVLFEEKFDREFRRERMMRRRYP